ncbi:MAG: fibrobacter succinogenes major paralogous domain-containing protein [Bacteroidales bacterium]|nr:fibrobacter succinogenes major paralogous domain-containing protein [Bacteroidales bacterium]
MNTRLKSLIFLAMICGSLLLLAISCKKQNDEAETVTDSDGNVYKTLVIGTQIWLAENLKTTKFNDGSQIPFVSEETSWVATLTTPGYCYYDNNTANKSVYGGLYNWYAVETGKLCPKGWHVPSDAEWTTITNLFGGESVAGNALKEKGTAHWTSPNDGATNESGFTALPGGNR